MEWNRDLTWTVADIRESEIGYADNRIEQRNTVSFDAMRETGQYRPLHGYPNSKDFKEGKPLTRLELSPPSLGTGPKGNWHGIVHGRNWRKMVQSEIGRGWMCI